MNLGIIAGNQSFPILLARAAKEKEPSVALTAICFYGETHPSIRKYVDRTVWLHVGEMDKLIGVIKNSGLTKLVMAGQINPRRIFNHSHWDKLMKEFVSTIDDFRPHTFFLKLIETLQKEGVDFLDSTVYMKDYLASRGAMNSVRISTETAKDIEFGTDIISGYVELDIGQTIAVKKRAVIALEAMEGTNAVIKRAGKIAGAGTVIIKFCKKNQDLRFDVPVVGLKTLRLLRKYTAAAVVLEAGRVIILDKEKFLRAAEKWKIAVIGEDKPS